VREREHGSTSVERVLGRRTASLGEALDALAGLAGPLRAATEVVADCYRAGGRVLVAGNGGSAAEAQHLTGELLGRLRSDRERDALAAVALTADTATITAVANDYGYDEVFARQVAGLGRPGDVLVVLSTSGRSANLVRAAEVAAERGLRTVGLLGRGPAPLHVACDHAVAVPSDDVATVQECHLLLVHVLVEAVEDVLGAVGGGAAPARVALGAGTALS
jgi:phosphoheptose isomerase